MKRMIKYPSIDQFRGVIKNVQHAAQYVRYDEATGQTIMNRGAAMPKVTAVATEKIHGSNMGICYSNPDGFWVQSRENIITPESDNAACAFNAMQNEAVWIELIHHLAEKNNINLDTHGIAIYAEFCGGNIQKNSAVSGLEKMSIIFKYAKVFSVDPESEEPNRWIETFVW